jgi:hypothetical protein
MLKLAREALLLKHHHSKHKDMSISPRPMSIQEAYKIFREQGFVVNRRYQRKLVWTEAEKIHLIDSILKNYPIPLILLAQRRSGTGGQYEIIDGMQRLHAIFSFIENSFAINQKYFDINELTRAKLAAEEGLFNVAPTGAMKLSTAECANLLDYQLAITSFPASSESQITDIFGRINAGGRQLSSHEKRQAGVVSPFSDIVRQISAELRGDSSKDILRLDEMPEISIEARSSQHGYGVQAEDTFWCRQGILRVPQLRESEDEQFVADLAASILFGSPIGYSREYLDELYNPLSNDFRDVNNRLASYGAKQLKEDITSIFSIIREIIEESDNSMYAFRNKVNGRATSNPMKIAFYTIFMAFFELMVKEGKSPTNSSAIMASVNKINSKLTRHSHHATTDDRIKNINIAKGLIQGNFVTQEPSVLRHGPGLALDLENSLKRSRIESSRYEFKQGILDLKDRKTNSKFVDMLCKEICSLANVGPHADSYLHLGVADSIKDAKRIESLDLISPIKVGDVWVVGIEREAILLKQTVENYVNALTSKISASKLSEPLLTAVLASIDTILYKGMSIIRFRIPAQQDPSHYDGIVYGRQNSSAVPLNAIQALSLAKLFTIK